MEAVLATEYLVAFHAGQMVGWIDSTMAHKVRSAGVGIPFCRRGEELPAVLDSTWEHTVVVIFCVPLRGPARFGQRFTAVRAMGRDGDWRGGVSSRLGKHAGSA